MQGNKYFLMAGVVATLFQAPAVVHAAAVTLGIQANGDIRGGSPAASFNGTYLAVINDNGNAGGAGKAYLRFQLPANFGTATSATFTIVRSNASIYDLRHAVFGLNNGTSGETTWTENTGTASDLTWNNAPGNVTTSTSDFANATSLGSFTTVGTNDATPGHVGDSYTISGAALVSFLNADTNGFVTLMINQNAGDVTNSEDLFASASNTTYAAPSLQLTYTPVPEPTSLAIIGTAVPVLLNGRRRRQH